MTHFSLFTGIGGIDLAAEWAGFATVGQCEIDDYATKVLEKNFPDVERWRDIKDVTVESFRERTGIAVGDLTLLSGGFPCQPHSLAGKRRASADERDLWGEFARIIREIKPKWVLGENVPGLLSSENGRFFGRILRDLDEMGYNVGWCSYGAVEVGAIHRRERVFIVAHAMRQRREPCRSEQRLSAWESAFIESGGDVSYTDGCGQQEYRVERQPSVQPAQVGCDISDTDDRSGIMRRNGQLSAVGETESGRDNHGERTPEYVTGEWWAVEPDVGRMAHGVPRRVDRLKCLGNAVVPQQVYPILAEIAQIENTEFDT